MNNPYTPTIEVFVDSRWKSRIAIDAGLLALLVIAWLSITYAVSLPASNMLSKEGSLIAISPFIPIYFLTAMIVGETSWAQLIAIFIVPSSIVVVGLVVGVRKKRTWIATIAVGVLYGLFLRLFYQICNIA